MAGNERISSTVRASTFVGHGLAEERLKNFSSASSLKSMLEPTPSISLLPQPFYQADVAALMSNLVSEN